MQKQVEIPKFKILNEKFDQKNSERMDFSTDATKDFEIKKTSSQVLNVDTILNCLKLEKYIPIFKENEIFLEDFFLLSVDDLKSLGLSLGARNRIKTFQEYFKRKGQQEVIWNLAFDEVLPAILEDLYS